MSNEETSYNSYEKESYAYEHDLLHHEKVHYPGYYGMTPYPGPHRHSHIPADHLDSRGNVRLWHEPDYLPLDSDGAIPAVSTLGRGPRGTGLVVDCEEGNDKFYLTIRDDVLGEVQYQTENLHAGHVSAHQVKGTPQPGLPTKFYIDVTRDGETTSYPIVANPAAPGTRFYLLDRPVEQKKSRRLADAYECESGELTHYVRGYYNNFPPPRPGDCIFCVVKSLDRTKQYSLGIGIIYSNDNGHICFFVRTILNTTTPWINEETETWWIGNIDTEVSIENIVKNVFIEELDCEEKPAATVEDHFDGTCDITLYWPQAHEYVAGYGLAIGNELHEFDVDTDVIATVEYTDEQIANLQDQIDNLHFEGTTYTAGAGIEISEEREISAQPAIDETIIYTDTETAKLQAEIDELARNLGAIYSAGDGISINDSNVISADDTIARTDEITAYVDAKDSALQEQINNLSSGEGGLYTAGYGIEISNVNQISLNVETLNEIVNNAVADAIEEALKYVYWDEEGYLVHEATIKTLTFVVDFEEDDPRPESITVSLYNKETEPTEPDYFFVLSEENNWTERITVNRNEEYEVVFDSIDDYDLEVNITDNIYSAIYVYNPALYYAALAVDTSDEDTYGLYFLGTTLKQGYPETDSTFTLSNGNEIRVMSIFTDLLDTNYSTEDLPPWNLYCDDIKYVIFNESFSTAQPKSLAFWFYEMKAITSIDISNVDTSQTESMKQMCKGCHYLETIVADNLIQATCTDVGDMFCYCFTLTGIDMSTWDTSGLIDMSGMFYNACSLTNMDFSALDLSSVETIKSIFMFSGGDLDGYTGPNTESKMITIDYGDNIFTNVVLVQTFYNMPSLTTIYCSQTWTASEDDKYSYQTFHQLYSLIGGNGTAFSDDYQTDEYARVDTDETPGYFTLPEANSDDNDNDSSSGGTDQETDAPNDDQY